MNSLEALSAIPTQTLLDQRYQKYRVIGAFDTLTTNQHGNGEPLVFP